MISDRFLPGMTRKKLCRWQPSRERPSVGRSQKVTQLPEAIIVWGRGVLLPTGVNPVPV